MLDILNNFSSVDLVTVLAAIGILSFISSLIVQVTKEIPGIASIPTKLWAIIISMIVCILAVVIYFQVKQIELIWYHIIFAILAGFIVSFIAIFGWDTFKELYDKFKYGAELRAKAKEAEANSNTNSDK